jgi:hypothetical protein
MFLMTVSVVEQGDCDLPTLRDFPEYPFHGFKLARCAEKFYVRCLKDTGRCRIVAASLVCLFACDVWCF